MIFRHRYGSPFPTGATVLDVSVTAGPPMGFEVRETVDGGLEFSAPLSAGDVLCGLGCNVSGINRRGWCFENDPLLGNAHAEARPSHYTIQNALVVIGRGKCYGFFVDAPSGLTFDLGRGDYERIVIRVQSSDLDFYLFTGETPVAVARELRRLTGSSYVPPKWAFGYGQSRWGYTTAEDVRTVAQRMGEAQLPLDAIYLDIDYMQDYRSFTVNKERFPDLPALAEELREQGIHLVTIVDSGILDCESDPVCQEGREKDYFCKSADGKDFVGAAWAGNIYLPDLLNDEARRWFGSHYKALLDMGVDGIWNDMNDPALFYSPEQRKKVMSAFDSPSLADRMDGDDYFHLMNLSRRMQNADNLYDNLLHRANGRTVSHRLCHNLYGLNMARSTAEAMEQLAPERRVLTFSRMSYIGAHRYGGTWTGDNSSWWSHLLLNIQQMVSLNLAGLLYSGADVGGFNENCTHDLLQRWMEFAIFTPLMRNHSTKTSVRQEPYEFHHAALFSRTIGLRYSLIPYLYSEFMKAVLEDTMLLRPLVFDYPDDERAAETEDQLMVGGSIMIAPVYQPNANSRSVYLPEPMKLLRLRSWEDYDTQDLPQGDTRIRCALGEVLVFLKEGCILPLCAPAPHVSQLDESHLKLFINQHRGEGVSYDLYRDDGETHDIHRAELRKPLRCDAYGQLSTDWEGLTLERARENRTF